MIGIVGLGNIGKTVARLANAFQMRVMAYHSHPTDGSINGESVYFQTLLRFSDIITLHVPLKDTTRYMIGPREFEIIKNDAFIINTSRGAIIDESSLIEALQACKIGGAWIDVYEQEPLPKDSQLRGLNNVILTLHISGEPDSRYFHLKRFKFFAENIKKLARGEVPENVINKL